LIVADEAFNKEWSKKRYPGLNFAIISVNVRQF